MMSNITTKNHLILVDGCGSEDDYELIQSAKMYLWHGLYERTSYVAIVCGKDAFRAYYDVHSRDFFNALLSNFIKQNKKDAKDCVKEDFVDSDDREQVHVATFDRLYVCSVFHK